MCRGGSKKRYPSVYWPEHPKATTSGMVYVHQVVALEKYGHIPDGHVVHHVNDDIWDWSPENVVLMDRGEHAAHHHSFDWPDDETVEQLVAEHGYKGAGESLGVAQSAVWRRLNRDKSRDNPTNKPAPERAPNVLLRRCDRDTNPTTRAADGPSGPSLVTPTVTKGVTESGAQLSLFSRPLVEVEP